MKALIIGDAACGDADIAQALDLFTPDAIAATNNRIVDYPGRLDYAFTLHPTPCRDWNGIEAAIKRRLSLGRNRPETWGHKPNKGIDKATPDWGGSTGLLAVKGLIEEGFTRIVLAGVPLEPQPHYYTTKPWGTFQRYRKGWTDHLHEIAPYTRSVSGWTMQLLGAPNKDWLGT